MQVIGNKALLVATREPNRITSTIGNSKLLETTNGESVVAVKWELPEAKALAALKFSNVPSPIMRDYNWPGKYKPYEHQAITSSFLTLHDKAFCFNEQGTCKTGSAIYAADYLMKQGLVKRVLVLCPLSIMKSVWQADLFKFAMHRSCAVAHGSAAARKKALETNAEFVILNFDGLRVVKPEVIAGGFDLVIVDEANAYKNAQTDRWKTLNDVMKGIKRLWMMTGTPAAQSPVDAFGLAKLVNPEGTPKYFNSFRDQVMYKLTQFKWAPRPGAQQYVHSILQPAIRYERKECLDLPPVTYMTRDVPLTRQQWAYYTMIMSQMRFEAQGETVTAVNAANNLSKLLQIAGGAVYTDSGDVLEFDIKDRLNVVVEVIEEASHKVLIFVPFTHTITLLANSLRRHGVSCDVINGPVSVNKRTEIVKRFQEQQDPQVLILQPQAAAHGLTLTAADTVVWYAPVTSVETYLQANARINRAGQQHNMSVIHVCGSKVEAKLYAMLQANILNHERLIQLYREALDE
jgi:superfamily II DNA or RNA helicase